MTPTQARAFHAVGKAGSFTSAARFLNVSQPTITTQVRELERTYGVELFVRSASGARLTETGTGLFRLVDQWHELQRECHEYLSSFQALQTGRLTIGTYGPYDAIDLTAVMRQRYPGLEIAVVFANSQQLKARLRSHEIDVAVMSGVTYGEDFACMKHRRRKLVALVANAHPWAQRTGLTMEELAREPLVCRERGSAVRDYLEVAAADKGLKLGWTTEIGSRDGIVAAVERGLGIGVIFDEGRLPADKVTILPLDNARCDATVDIVCLAERSDNRLIKSFVDLAAKEALRLRAEAG
ncbi:MAG: LysR substrate-binding domain-containing protein [Pseudomonadota bacterium]|nr:LysR substrate-binding domain-containing protein [Pseudomonadota bacterium]